jgi:hypothetical protein
MNFGQRAGVGCGRKWGERKGAPKFISAWVVSRSGVTEINFGQRAGAGRGRTRGAAGCAEIRFGMGWGRTWGRAKGCAEIHFGMGCEQKRGDRNKFRSTGRRGAGADAGCGRVRRNSFRHGLGEDMGRAKGCAEIHFGMGWGRTRGDRNKFRSTLRRTRASRATRQTWTGVNASENRYNSQSPSAPHGSMEALPTHRRRILSETHQSHEASMRMDGDGTAAAVNRRCARLSNV